MPDGATPAAEHFEPPLDPGIAHAVLVLRAGGVETYESCQGGEDHAYPYPCVRFFGTDAGGWRALSVALTQELPVYELAQVWGVENDHPVGPTWELRFSTRPGAACSCRTEASRSSRPYDSSAESAGRSDNPRRCGARQDRSDRSSDRALPTESPSSIPSSRARLTSPVRGSRLTMAGWRRLFQRRREFIAA